MRSKASQSNPQVAMPDSWTDHIRRQPKAQYQTVYDERKRPIRGLWVRDDILGHVHESPNRIASVGGLSDPVVSLLSNAVAVD